MQLATTDMSVYFMSVTCVPNICSSSALQSSGPSPLGTDAFRSPHTSSTIVRSRCVINLTVHHERETEPRYISCCTGTLQIIGRSHGLFAHVRLKIRIIIRRHYSGYLGWPKFLPALTRSSTLFKLL